ncbi:MAG TPA: M23 family metallopeptidase [Xanthobacteraceae bacterium]|nr:M23 family metallopeptidase [Xanthobacteraceae bacterium]
MSQWSASRSPEAARSQYPTHYSAQAARRDGVRRGEARALGLREGAGRAYTLAHAGRQIRFGPVVFWIAVGTVVIMAGWSITAATYLAFRDDVLRTLIARQAEQQFAYEDRIAELRAQIDRTTSRQLLDQEQFEQKLDELLRRQATLEQRATALGNIADPVTTGSIGPAAAKPIGDLAPRSERGRQSSIPAALGRLEASLDRVETRQATALDRLQARFEGKARRIREVIAGLGLKLDALPEATGGPFVPVRLPNQGFERELLRVNLVRSEADQLGDALRTLPIRKPVTGALDETSPFGVRMDPFNHEAAMHTGIDFRGDVGEPVHATAAGTVTIAGWDAGYGKMVEIDHGNGLASRYAHLSEIDVSVGDKVRIGEIVGRIGSTGRSTGPHLHYETRVNGEAVNPQKFLNAGDRLFGG